MYKKFMIWYLITALGTLPLCPTVQGADETSDKNIEVRTLSLAPASEPVPALSYRLLPRYLDQKTGNAALLYYSAASLYPGNSEDIHEKIRKWRDLPVDQLDRKEVDEVLSSFSSCFHQIKLAAQRNHCQWEMPLEEGFAMQIPNLLSFRNMIRAMQLQIRLNIADGQIDQALEMLQQGLYMGRNIAEGPTIIQDLVGASVTSGLLKEVEGLMQISDSPNLYWALTSLPDPFIDMHSAIQYEREVLFFEFPQLRNLESQVLTLAQASLIISDIINKIQALGGGSMDDAPFKELIPAGWVMMHYSDAKKHLASKGYSQERIEAMLAAQAVLIYQKQQYMEIADNLYKWFEIPYYQGQPYLQKGEQLLSDHHNTKGIKANLFYILLPALYRIAFLQARLDRNIALLRTIEAIRMFAADNSGKLPDSLGEITSVPISTDPVTGKDFIYRRVDIRNARLEAPVSPDKSGKRPVYELTIKQ